MCMCICLWRLHGSDPIELESEVVVSHSTLVLETKLVSFLKVVPSLNL